MCVFYICVCVFTFREKKVTLVCVYIYIFNIGRCLLFFHMKKQQKKGSIKQIWKCKYINKINIHINIY